MISIIIPATQREGSLITTLSALVPAAVDGLVSEVIVADRGSRHQTAAIADAAGCKFVVADGPPSSALRTAAAAARAPWLLFLRPGAVLDAGWIGEARRFIERPAKIERAATFRRAAPAHASLRELRLLVAERFGVLPHPDRGLLIAREFYRVLGGHRDGAADAETDFIRRIGRRRITILAAAAIRLDT